MSAVGWWLIFFSRVAISVIILESWPHRLVDKSRSWSAATICYRPRIDRFIGTKRNPLENSAGERKNGRYFEDGERSFLERVRLVTPERYVGGCGAGIPRRYPNDRLQTFVHTTAYGPSSINDTLLLRKVCILRLDLAGSDR